MDAEERFERGGCLGLAPASLGAGAGEVDGDDLVGGEPAERGAGHVLILRLKGPVVINLNVDTDASILWPTGQQRSAAIGIDRTVVIGGQT